jgi:hypothetical protein
MKRRTGLYLAALGLMATIALVGGAPKDGKLLLLDWSAKSGAQTPPVAILIEMGLKDGKSTGWNGHATVSGAKVVHREGYCFRAGEKLVEPDAWQASSHRPLRLPPRQPALLLLEGIAPVGVVLHLADAKPDAVLSLNVEGQEPEKAEVPLKEVLAGQPAKVWNGHARVRRISTTSPVSPATANTEDDFPAAAYGPDGTLWVAYIAYTLKEESRRIEAANLKEQPKDFKSYYTPDFGDQLLVNSFKGGKWSEPIAITGPNEDLMKCAIAVEGDGTAWVAYSANKEGKHTIRLRPVTSKQGAEPVVGPEQVLTIGMPGLQEKLEGPHLDPRMCTDQLGKLWLAVQSFDKQWATIQIFSGTNGKWTQRLMPIHPRPKRWHPAIASGPAAELAVANDAYDWGNYDVNTYILKDGKFETSVPSIAASPRFEARPAVCYDPQGRLWIAYEEGPEGWGKDYGPLEKKPGDSLYSQRSVRVVCLKDGKLYKTAAELPTAPNSAPRNYPWEANANIKFELQPRYSQPSIGIDGKGRVWVSYRQKFGSRYSSHAGSYWKSFVRRLDGDQWSEPIELHHSDGTLDQRDVLLPHAAGGLLVVHKGDGRWEMPDTLQNRVYTSYVDLPGDPVEPKLLPQEPGKKDLKVPEEEKLAQRARDYRVKAGDKEYRLLRGEFHRHTEISWDGGPDGSLEDMFRYAIDAASLDWIGNTDHDNGAGREYTWWLTQKLTDAYHVKDHFTPVFAYERSVSYPHGHRNCIFVRRGIRTLPRLAEPDPDKRVAGIHADDTKMFYRYLHELDGICASHTSATSMGTDWRDNDPKVEPIVEIYQGDRMSYEMEGAPRAGYDPKDKDKFPPNIAGWFPKGFINLALQKGYRLGFQSSSDHWSTHISFCVALAERHDRQGIVDALKKRHCYAATDDIILDVRSGSHIMGDEFKSAETPRLDIVVLGTGPLSQVDILRDSDVVHTFKPKGAELKETWTDPKPLAGTHYYYVRVQQARGEIAWGSPMWIDYAK